MRKKEVGGRDGGSTGEQEWLGKEGTFEWDLREGEGAVKIPREEGTQQKAEQSGKNLEGGDNS